MSIPTSVKGRLTSGVPALLAIVISTQNFPVLAHSSHTNGKFPQTAPAVGKEPTGGRIFESVQGGFRIRLPNDFRDPVRQNRYLKNNAKSFPAFLSLSDRGAFTVVPVDPPKGVEPTPENLREIAESELQLTKTKAEKELILQRRDEKGIEVFFKKDLGGQIQHSRIQFIAAPHRWFELIFISMNRDLREAPDIAEAFNSFEVLPAVMIKDFKSETTPELPFEPQVGNFKLVLPPGFQTPIDQSSGIAGLGNKMKVTQFLSTGATGLIVMTRFSEIRGMTTPKQINRAREGLTGGILEALKGKVVKSGTVVRQGASCQELRITSEISGQVFNGRCLIYTHKKSFYMFFFLSPSTTTLDSPEAERFFDSIRISP